MTIQFVEKYLENKLRENFDLEGTPIVLQFKNKNGEYEECQRKCKINLFVFWKNMNYIMGYVFHIF